MGNYAPGEPAADLTTTLEHMALHVVGVVELADRDAVGIGQLGSLRLEPLVVGSALHVKDIIAIAAEALEEFGLKNLDEELSESSGCADCDEAPTAEGEVPLRLVILTRPTAFSSPACGGSI